MIYQGQDINSQCTVNVALPHDDRFPHVSDGERGMEGIHILRGLTLWKSEAKPFTT